MLNIQLATGAYANLDPESVASVGPGAVKGEAVINIGTLSIAILHGSPGGLAKQIGKARGRTCPLLPGPKGRPQEEPPPPEEAATEGDTGEESAPPPSEEPPPDPET